MNGIVQFFSVVQCEKLGWTEVLLGFRFGQDFAIRYQRGEVCFWWAETGDGFSKVREHGHAAVARFGKIPFSCSGLLA